MIALKGSVSPEYLQATAAVVQQNKQRSYEMMRIAEGHTVLDVGCGTGIDTVVLGGLVGRYGRVVGVDHDALMIAAAERRAAQPGLTRRVQHVQADAAELPFASDTFDSARSERLVQHLTDAQPAVAEMVRVVRLGGWVMLQDIDWGNASIDAPEVEVERVLARVRAERVVRNGYAGRQLYRLCSQQGLQDITVDLRPTCLLSYPLAREIGGFDLVEAEAVAAGLLTGADIERWRRSLEAADAAGLFFSSAITVLVAGRKT